MKRFLILILVIEIFLTRIEADCDLIPVCKDFELEHIPDESEDGQNPPLPDYEYTIPQQGHWAGIKPVRYKINLNFHNQSYYNGSVHILFKVLENTDEIQFNLHVSNPWVDYNKITIQKQNPQSQNHCSADKPRHNANKPPPETKCIEKATFAEVNRTVFLNLKDATLEAGNEYVLSFASIGGRSSVDESVDNAALGIKEAETNIPHTEDEDNEDVAVASTTIFQMRYARTVFPCFDQPSLKAIFSLCVEYPNYLQVASNTLPAQGYPKNVGKRKKQTCFENTPAIPTYIFTFAIMDNYTLQSTQVPNGGPKIELYAPRGREPKLRWILDQAVAAFQELQRMVKFKYPLKRLAFVVQYPAPFWGVENFGLITLEGAFMEQTSSSDTAYKIVTHEVIHQWLGNVVTISNWREICLQEGLTAYIEWAVTAKLMNKSLDDTVANDGLSTDSYTNNFYKPDAEKDYVFTKDISDTCFGRPPVFFHSIAAAYGFGTVERFLGKLVEKKTFETANIDVYDEVLTEVTNGSLKGYFKGWFLQRGPLYLLATKVPRSDCILVKQQLYTKQGDKPDTTVARPVPVTIKLFGSSGDHKKTVLNSLENRVCGFQGLADAGFLVDLNDDTYTRKVYYAQNYLRMLKLEERDHVLSVKSSKPLQTFLRGFCKGLLNNILPLPDDPNATNGTMWLDIYERIQITGVPLSSCTCCLKGVDDGARAEMNCRFMGCDKLRLSKVVGLDFGKPRKPGKPEQ